jgi:hypothetical protein
MNFRLIDSKFRYKAFLDYQEDFRLVVIHNITRKIEKDAKYVHIFS